MTRRWPARGGENQAIVRCQLLPSPPQLPVFEDARSTRSSTRRASQAQICEHCSGVDNERTRIVRSSNRVLSSVPQIHCKASPRRKMAHRSIGLDKHEKRAVVAFISLGYGMVNHGTPGNLEFRRIVLPETLTQLWMELIMT
jgi:hypothetical protein